MGEAENGAVRVRRRLAILTLAIVGVGLAATAQNQDRDPYRASKTSATAPSPETRTDINHATTDELLNVPGMTRSWAGRIIRFRPYRVKGDLMEMGVVPDYFFDRIKDYIIAHHEKQ